MIFVEGNRFWEARSKHGRDPIFDDPEVLWGACEEYFKWVEENPLKEDKPVHYQGAMIPNTVNKMRAMTIGGLCIFLDICEETWTNYRNKPDFLGVTKKAEKIIRNQKFTGASADLLNANIIARDLGLVDKKEVGGDKDRPITVITAEMSGEEATKLYKALIDD